MTALAQGRVGSGGPEGPTTTAPANLPAALHILPEWQGPVVVIDYRPPCRLTRSELSNGPDGVDPADVVKSLCRALDVGPGALEFDFDPANRRGIHEAASCYVIDALGVRIARVRGESAVWLTVAGGKLARDGWRPGRHAERVA